MSTMFVKVSTPEGQTSITVEQFAAAMAEHRAFIYDDTANEHERIADILHKLTVAGFISEVYKDDFYTVAQTMSKYVRVNVAKSPYYPSNAHPVRSDDELKERNASHKQYVANH